MAVDLFDPSQIENAVGEAFGRKPTSKPATQPAPAAPQGPNLSGLDQPLAQSLERARAAYKQQYGTDMPISSGVRSRAEQQKLYDDWKAGKSGVFMPLNPAQYPDRQTFHTEAVDIPTSVPESFLNQYGIHRPMGKKDPVHAVLMPGQKAAAAPSQSQGFSIIPSAQAAVPGSTTEFANFKPEDINASVNEAFQNPEPQKPQGATGKVASKVGEFFRGQGRAAASLADTLYGVVPAAAGMVTYAGARAAGQTPEEAAGTQQKVVGAIDKPFGKAFGVTETPEYRGEASQRIMNFIGENMGKGADWISQQTGMPKADVEYYMNLAAVAAPGGIKAAKGTKVGQAISTEAGYVGEAAKQAGGKTLEAVKAVTPERVQTAVGRTVEAIAPGTTNVKPRAAAETLGGQPQVAPYAQPGTAPGGNVVQFPTPTPTPAAGAAPRASVGAAATTDANMVRQALQTATPEFQQLYGNMPLDKANMPVVMRHLEADSLPIPVRLSEGQATGDLVKISHEQNIRGKPEGQQLAYRFNEQNKALVDNVPLIKEQAAPDVYAPRTIDSSEAIIKAYKDLDATKNTDISAAYKALEDANGGKFPVDGVKLAENAEALLGRKLKTEFLPSSIKSQLNRFKAGEPMTYEQFEAMRTNLAAEIRKAERSGDGNAKMAASLVYEALDNLPLTGDAAALKPLADKARTLAKARFDQLKADPAYRAAINDKVPADKFLDTFVIKGHNKNVQTMVDTLGRGSEAHQHMMAGTINHLGERAGIMEGKGNFSQKNYNTALNNLDKNRNLQAIFNPETQLQLKTLGNVANYTQFQPRGSFVNNSNTLVGYLAEKGANLAEGAGNVAGLKFMGGYPVGSEARRFIRSRKERAQVEKALEPGAGSTLEDIKNRGQ